jgi:hypothetical protein
VLRVAQDFGVGFLPSMPGVAAWFVPLLGVLELRRVLRTLVVAGRRRQLRMEYRVPLETSAFVEQLGAFDSGAPTEMLLPAKVSDITLSGLGFETSAPLPQGSLVRLSLHLPGIADGDSNAISLLAKVRSCRQTTEGFRIGTEMAVADETTRRRIIEYCHVVWPYRRLHGSAPSLVPVPVPVAVPWMVPSAPRALAAGSGSPLAV